MARSIPKPKPELKLTDVVNYLGELQGKPDEPKNFAGVLAKLREHFGVEEVNTLLGKTVVQLVSEIRLGDLIVFCMAAEQLRGK